jgi:hypothetical protein
VQDEELDSLRAQSVVEEGIIEELTQPSGDDELIQRWVGGGG